MGSIHSLDLTRRARARSAGIAIGYCAERVGVDSKHATGYAIATKNMVLAGHSAAHAVRVIRRQIIREFPVTS